MTACVIEPAAGDRGGDGDGFPPRPGCVITVDGGYAARLTRSGDSWFPERWTLDGPEPYAVPLPGNQPEEPGTEVQPMGDGRVLIRRHAAGRHAFSLLYPAGPGTGELPLGAVECGGAALRLLPPAPGGDRAYALAAGPRSSAVWLVAGGAFGPEHVAEVPGRCSGGVWLDRSGRMLALDRELDGRTKSVVVDLERGGEVSPLLQIAADSDDRLLLADPDSGLLLIRSDAPSPGHARLGWGVLGSTLPVRFPECLRGPADRAVTPFAIQPGQVLTPESCGVALRIDGPAGSWIGVWRPAERQVHHLPAPPGWLAGTGLWTPGGVLRLPYATRGTPCGVAEVTPPAPAVGADGAGSARAPRAGGARPGGDARGGGDSWRAREAGPGAAGETAEARGVITLLDARRGTAGAGEVAPRAIGDARAGGPGGDGAGRTASPPGARPAEPDPPGPAAPRPVPLQQAPLGDGTLERLVTNRWRSAWPSGFGPRCAG
ncbi:hypothetical protein [Streptomyces glaucescens]|nr:hypothetical protein [Streptomyces glaucescens]